MGTPNTTTLAIRQERIAALKRRMDAPRPIDTLDVACRVCGATYTTREAHDCPGYDLWAPRKLHVFRVGVEEAVLS